MGAIIIRGTAIFGGVMVLAGVGALKICGTATSKGGVVRGHM